jgi:RecJ-like exonuclease
MSERQRMIVCPECAGAGLVGRLQCDVCRGIGSAPEQVERWRLVGAECRSARDSIRATLREASVYTGLAVKTIARMEAGLCDPSKLQHHWFRG